MGIDKRNAENAFFEFFLREVSTTPPPARPIYPRGGDPSPSAPGQTAQHRQQGRPCQMQGRPRHAPTHTPGHWTRCTGLHSIPDRPRGAIGTAAERWRAWSVSETEQICTHSNMNDFQHKNVCKIIDINTRTCYYIDNTRTCYTTTKTGGQKP